MKVTRNEKNFIDFLIHKIWHLQEHFIKHKSLISQEWLSKLKYFLCNIYTVSCQLWWYKFVFILYASALHMWTNSKYVICLRRFSSFKSFPLPTSLPAWSDWYFDVFSWQSANSNTKAKYCSTITCYIL